MNLSIIKLNLNSGVNQDELMQFLKTNGNEVIQISNGLCVKSEKNQTELKKMIEEKGMAQLNVEALDHHDENLPEDVKSFIAQ